VANRRSFKTDESFLEKLAIGAIGARAVFDRLKQEGHRPIELERGSMSYKLWKQIKIKRVRVPDILCLKCGTRFEARAKTQLEISMSHSLSDPERGWDKGLGDRDVVALAVCTKAGERPVDWQARDLIQFVRVGELRRAFDKNRVILTKPKGAEEGFEVRVTWPSAVASSDGRVTNIMSNCIKFQRDSDGRTISLGLNKGGVRLRPLVKVNEVIHAGQIIASVVPVASYVPCVPADAKKAFLELLASSAISDRYTAVKALSHLRAPDVAKALRARMNDEREHIYVRLEAAAGLARLKTAGGMQFIRRTLAAEYLEHRLEAVIILGEIPSKDSARTLTAVLHDRQQHAEIRAGAAWALGELRRPECADALIQVFLELAPPIRIEAARALRKIAEANHAQIVAKFPSAQDDQRAGIAWALSRSRRVNVPQLIQVMVDDDARRWVAYIMGTQPRESLLTQIEDLQRQDPEVYFAVTVLWKILASWVYNLEEF